MSPGLAPNWSTWPRRSRVKLGGDWKSEQRTCEPDGGHGQSAWDGPARAPEQELPGGSHCSPGSTVVSPQDGGCAKRTPLATKRSARSVPARPLVATLGNDRIGVLLPVQEQARESGSRAVCGHENT